MLISMFIFNAQFQCSVSMHIFKFKKKFQKKEQFFFLKVPKKVRNLIIKLGIIYKFVGGERLQIREHKNDIFHFFIT
jgi:hypothetical protein